MRPGGPAAGVTVAGRRRGRPVTASRLIGKLAAIMAGYAAFGSQTLTMVPAPGADSSVA